MTRAYDLSQLDPYSFEHMVNALAVRVLGSGHTSFSPGADGGRDGYFRGAAPYPSVAERWKGTWYIQSKFHAPHLSKDPQKWLVEQIESELKKFKDPDGRRSWPDIWIIATNIDPSGAPETGAFDVAQQLVLKTRRKLAPRFHIWGGAKLLNYLAQFPDVAARYGHFLTPGHVITELYATLSEAQASAQTTLNYLVTTALIEQQYTKLEQAGSRDDTRPGIHTLFVDLPFSTPNHISAGGVLNCLLKAAAENYRVDHGDATDDAGWKQWKANPERSQIIFAKAGPGQGKSTVGQYFCQILRAFHLLDDPLLSSHSQARELANAIKSAAQPHGWWPSGARIPVYVELRDYAHWYGSIQGDRPRGVLSFLAHRLSLGVEENVPVGTLRKLLKSQRWAFVFDGLDEVPDDTKDEIAKNVRQFILDTSAVVDLFVYCTSRPQGYSGQFDALPCTVIEFSPLSPSAALACALPVISIGRAKHEAQRAREILENSLRSDSVKELMTTPLQSHIMAIVVRSGQRPPERKWELYRQFYEVIRSREADRDLPDLRLANLLRQDTTLLRAVHNRLGFLLQARAQTAQGARASLRRSEFRQLVERTVREMKEGDEEQVIETVMKAATERLVLISTPDDGEQLRFDVRQLQEFFAAEYLYDGVTFDAFRDRLAAISGEPHWREVMHFLLSALIESNRRTELGVALEVIQTTDDGEQNDDERILCQRLARGALIASRLLEDGVLEPDRRVRNLFRDRLTPVASATDVGLVRPLLQTKGSASRAWLYELMKRRFEEGTPAEGFGAAQVLWGFTTDAESSVGRIRLLLERLPEAYWIRLVWNSLPVMLLGRPHNWQIDFFASLLASHEKVSLWRVAALDYLVAQRRLYPGDREGRQVVGRLKQQLAERLGEEATDIVKLFEAARADRLEALKFGPGCVRFTKYEVRAEGDASEWRVLADRLADVTWRGLFGFLAACVTFAGYQSKRNYVVLLSLIGDSWNILSSLPSRLGAQIPVPDAGACSPSELLGCLSGVSEESFTLRLGEGWIGPFAFAPRGGYFEADRRSRQPRWDATEWRRLVEEFPAIACCLVDGISGVESTASRALSEDSYVEPIVALVASKPDKLRSLPPHAWGLIVPRLGTAEPRARERLASDVARDELSFWRYSAPQRIHPFELRFPEEASLLVPVVRVVVEQYAETFRGPIYFSTGEAPVARPEQAAQRSRDQVRAYVGRLSGLLDVANDPRAPAKVRGAALLAGMVHPEGGTDVAIDFSELLVDLAREVPPLTVGFLLSVDILSAEAEPRIRGLSGKMLDAAKLHLEERFACDEVLARWRERTRSRLRASAFRDEWLTGWLE